MNQLTAFHRHEMYIDFIIDGASEAVRLGSVSTELDRLRVELGRKIVNQQSVRDLSDKLKMAFENAKLSFTEDKRIREMLGETTGKVLAYSAERSLFQSAWKSEVDTGSAVMRLGVLFALGGGITGVGIFFGLEAWYVATAFLAAMIFSLVAGGVLIEIRDLARLMKKSRSELEQLLESEQHGVPGLEVEEV